MRTISNALLTAMSCALLFGVTQANSQQVEVVVDWSAKKVTSPPGNINNNVKAKVRLDNVNDLMFTYPISYQLVPLQISDFDSIAKAFALAGASATKGGEAATTDCDFSKVDAAFKDLTDAQTTFLALPTVGSGCSTAKPCDVTIGQAQGAWTSSVHPKIVAAQSALTVFTASCKSDTYSAAINSAQTALDSSHASETRVLGTIHTIEKTDAIVLSPDSTTHLEVDQLYNGVTTTNGTYTVDLTPTNNRLTLSAGAIFTEVQNRAYTSRAVPSTTGTGTMNVLSVDGISRLSPSAVALLNYQIPYLDSEQAGLAVSTGPVFRLGSSSDASSFGYFAGLSLHLYHRFYISPGFHLGQFADYPTGFTAPNQAIPSGVGTPTPVKRWTVRFAIGVTYKAKDFSGLGLSSSVTPTTKAGASTGTNTPGAATGVGGTGGSPPPTGSTTSHNTAVKAGTP
jgi:hypothetical protein